MTSISLSTHHGTAPRGVAPGARLGLLARIFERLLLWQERAAQRHALAGLDDRMLKDVGLTRAQALHEAGKPFWRR